MQELAPVMQPVVSVLVIATHMLNKQRNVFEGSRTTINNDLPVIIKHFST